MFESHLEDVSVVIKKQKELFYVMCGNVPMVARCAQTSQCPHYCLFKTYFVILVSAPALLLLMVPRGHGAWTHALCHPEQKTVPNIKFNFQFKIIKNENKGLMPLVVAINGKVNSKLKYSVIQ